MDFNKLKYIISIAIGFGFLIPFIIFASPVPKVIVLTSGTSWTVPTDWNNDFNKIQLIGDRKSVV